MIARGKRLANNRRTVNVDCCCLRAGALSAPDPDLPDLAGGAGGGAVGNRVLGLDPEVVAPPRRA